MLAYLAAILLLMLVLPLASAGIEAGFGSSPRSASPSRQLVHLRGGVRLVLAGAMQVFRPQFTSEGLLGIEDPGATVIVREVGFGNLAIGTLGLLSLYVPGFLAPAAVAGGVFYLLAGLGHAARKDKTAKEWVALVSDLGMALVLAAFLASRLV